MATGTVILPIAAAELDATAPPGVQFVNSVRRLLFDDTTIEKVYWQFRMPENYASGPVLKLQYSMASATSLDVSFDAYLHAVTPGDAAAVDTENYDTGNEATDTVPGTAGHMKEISITLTNADSVAAGDWVALKLEREADDATNDDATGDAELWNVSLEYTTT